MAFDIIETTETLGVVVCDWHRMDLHGDGVSNDFGLSMARTGSDRWG